MIHRSALLQVLTCVLLLLAGCSGELTVEDPWVRAAPPGRHMTAGYLTLNNASNSAATLVGASCDSFDDVSLHETRVENGTSKIRHIDTLAVPGDSTVNFSPGGRHLMLMGPSRTLSAGDTVKITLHFADHDDVTVAADIRP